MDDFDAPSFSLGLDCLEPSQADPPFIVPASDLDFETPVPTSRNTTALKRLRRKSSPFFHGSQRTSDILQEAQQNACRSSRRGTHEKKNSCSRNTKKSILSSANTLQRLWNDFNGKIVSSRDDNLENAVDGFVGQESPALVEIENTTIHESGRREKDDGFQNAGYEGFTDNKNIDCDASSVGKGITRDVNGDPTDPTLRTGGIQDRFSSPHENAITASRSCINVKESPPHENLFENIADESENGDNSCCKTNILQSFWKSLNTRKQNSEGRNIHGEYEEIEDCSTDDDYDVCRRLSWNKTSSSNWQMPGSTNVLSPGTNLLSPRRLSLSANPAKRKSTLTNASRQVSEFEELGNMSGQSIARCKASPSNSLEKNPTCVNMGWQKPRSIEDAESSQHRTWQDMNSSTKSSSNTSILRTANDLNFSVHNINHDIGSDVLRHDKYVINGESQIHHHDNTKSNLFSGLNFPANGKAISSFQGRPNTCLHASMTEDPRIIDLLRSRFPHFIAASELRQGSGLGPDHTYIDYENQFSGNRNAVETTTDHPITQKYRNRIAKKPNSRKSRRNAVADNDGWIQTNNRTVRSKSNRCGKQSRGQTLINEESGAGPGHWVTEKTGKRIYITRDGQKLSGSSAYKQHIKDSGKRFKKTKRRRPRGRK